MSCVGIYPHNHSELLAFAMHHRLLFKHVCSVKLLVYLVFCYKQSLREEGYKGLTSGMDASVKYLHRCTLPHYLFPSPFYLSDFPNCVVRFEFRHITVTKMRDGERTTSHIHGAQIPEKQTNQEWPTSSFHKRAEYILTDFTPGEATHTLIVYSLKCEPTPVKKNIPYCVILWQKMY